MTTEDTVRTGPRTHTGSPPGGGSPPGDTPPGSGARARDLRQLITYALVGGSGVLLDLGAFLLFYNVAGLHEQVANVLSTSLGITNNFVLNALFTFGKRDRLLLRYLRFYAVGLTGIALTFVLLAVFSRGLGVDPNLVKAGSLPLVLAFQFALNRKWSFA
ncbi:GtrA family protein [Streptomyces rishiriensis]|uniref:Flippase GtrA n=1 Tax=Streptomyces rishiriensis TaxID=68264 RepID=A0ABU0NV82_STRRH|nr:GtrA family protein [Streptomyces rishiriensis]MDQ0583050.1 putative flippase GtrA [Streptomyces rishiriensis]